jgi:hypothetical protein
MCWQKFSLGLILTLCLSLAGMQTVQAQVDNTYCTVKSTSDDVNNFHSLRRKLEQGFNRLDQGGQRSCTDLINFDGTDGEPMVIVLTKPLEIKGEEDLDCTITGHPLCNDNVTFKLDGTSHSAGVVIDTTKVNGGDDKCAILVTGLDQVYTGITVRTNQHTLKGSQGDSAVICENGNNNDFTGVEIESVGPTPPPTEECGNGVKEGNEECDEGANNSSTGICSSLCTLNTTNDTDGDGVLNDQDNCPTDHNTDQANCDMDDKGDKCDNDYDNDGMADGVDNCAPDFQTVCVDGSLSNEQKRDQLALSANGDQSDIDSDDLGDHCDGDMDGDGFINDEDN